jgi:hypothetical protein
VAGASQGDVALGLFACSRLTLTSRLALACSSICTVLRCFWYMFLSISTNSQEGFGVRNLHLNGHVGKLNIARLSQELHVRVPRAH